MITLNKSEAMDLYAFYQNHINNTKFTFNKTNLDLVMKRIEDTHYSQDDIYSLKK